MLKNTLRLFLIFCLLMSATATFGQTDSTRRSSFSLIGASYTFLTTSEQGQWYWGYSNELHTRKIHSVGVDWMYFTGRRLGLHFQARHLQVQWSSYRFRDARHLFIPQSYPYWRQSESRYTDDIVVFSPSITFSSKGERVKVVAEIGPEAMIVLKRQAVYYETYGDTAGSPPSHITTTEATQGPVTRFAKISGHVTARLGITAAVYKSFYFSLFVHGRLIMRDNFISRGDGIGVLSGFGCGIYYRL